MSEEEKNWIKRATAVSDTTISSNGGEGLFEGDDERGEGGGEAGAGGQDRRHPQGAQAPLRPPLGFPAKRPWTSRGNSRGSWSERGAFLRVGGRRGPALVEEGSGRQGRGLHWWLGVGEVPRARPSRILEPIRTQTSCVPGELLRDKAPETDISRRCRRASLRGVRHAAALQG